MTITEFLLARIAEREALVRDPRYIWSLDHPEIGAPEKVLAECEAKRQIVEAAMALDDEYAGVGLRIAVYHLAAVHADHPGYREEWRP